jgi:hypothetical protein
LTLFTKFIRKQETNKNLNVTIAEKKNYIKQVNCSSHTFNVSVRKKKKKKKKKRRRRVGRASSPHPRLD